eukprot:c16327_g1_i1 orf=385-1572(+)
MMEVKECAARQLGRGACTGPARLRCGSCGAISYCSSAHQRLHWQQHKEECERMAQQMQRSAIVHDFPFSFAEETTLQVDMGVSTLCSFFERCGIHMLGLWQFECECGHDKFSLLGYGNTNDDFCWHLPSNICPCTDALVPLVDSLESWASYYIWRRLPFHSPVAMLLHWPATVYHALRIAIGRMQNSFPRPGDFLRIHYLGPERELDQLATFAELHALLPMVQIQIDFIGPAIPSSRNGEVIILKDYMPCSDAVCQCKIKNTNAENVGDDHVLEAKQSNIGFPIYLKLWKGLYHDLYSQLVKDSLPHLIFAPNAGIAASSSWLPTIELISTTEIPMIITDFCEEAAFLAVQCISSALALPITYPVQVNPFRQPTVPPEKILEVPTYSNCFIFGIN